MTWTHAGDLPRLRERGKLVAKLAGKQIVLFERGGQLYACNNRCPHEGYPLSEGTFDDGCVLTCNWHNWKFDLSNGANLLGGDALRTYPVRLEGDAIWVDLHEPPAAARRAEAESRLHEAFLDHDYDRIAREIARFLKAEGRPESVVRSAISWAHDRLEFGMTHAFPAAEAWLRLRDERGDDAERLVCLLEAVGHLAYDTLREERHSYSTEIRDYDESEFLAAIEAQDEAQALALTNGALASSAGFASVEHGLTAAALAHYQDFGHSLIYVKHARLLVARLGREVEAPLARVLVRSLVHASREDLIPQFREYARSLGAWPEQVASAANPGAGAEAGTEADSPRGGVHTRLIATLELAGRLPVEAVFERLLWESAHHLLRFDASVQDRTDNSVDENVGWLDVTHEITFANAVREQCTRFPDLWPRGLLQMACFLGRNDGYVDSAAPVDRWYSADRGDLEARCVERILDPGLDRYIFSVHLLKTFLASRDELTRLPDDDPLARPLMAGLDRFFQSPIKPRHVLRTARQALSFVALEG